MASSPANKLFGMDDAATAEYVRDTFHIDDQAFDEIRQRAASAGLPVIHVGHYDARHLEVLARALGARKIVEIGTLAGLSGLALARALPQDGHLHTFEFDPKHAAVARETFSRYGVAAQVTVHVGPALHNLPLIEQHGPFDLVFIDANKEDYPHYAQWAAQHLRTGGAVLVDNSFAWGYVAMPADEIPAGKHQQRDAIDRCNRYLGSPDGPFRSTMLPTGEGLVLGVKK